MPQNNPEKLKITLGKALLAHFCTSDAKPKKTWVNHAIFADNCNQRTPLLREHISITILGDVPIWVGHNSLNPVYGCLQSPIVHTEGWFSCSNSPAWSKDKELNCSVSKFTWPVSRFLIKCCSMLLVTMSKEFFSVDLPMNLRKHIFSFPSDPQIKPRKQVEFWFVSYLRNAISPQASRKLPLPSSGLKLEIVTNADLYHNCYKKSHIIKVN